MKLERLILHSPAPAFPISHFNRRKVFDSAVNMADTNPATTEPSASSSASAPAQPPSESCAQCAATPESLKQCIKCHSVSYCNRDCQKAHFKTHKKECAALAQAYVQEHAPKMASRAPPRESGKGKGIGKWEVSNFFIFLILIVFLSLGILFLKIKENGGYRWGSYGMKALTGIV